jgi:hypothetical protein
MRHGAKIPARAINAQNADAGFTECNRDEKGPRQRRQAEEQNAAPPWSDSLFFRTDGTRRPITGIGAHHVLKSSIRETIVQGIHAGT